VSYFKRTTLPVAGTGDGKKRKIAYRIQTSRLRFKQTTSGMQAAALFGLKLNN